MILYLERVANGKKLCSKCNQAKTLDAFAKNSARADGLQDWCRVCKKANDAGYYQKNKNKYLEYNRQQYRRDKERLNALKARPCTDCGGTSPPYVMDFDHIGDLAKLFNVSKSKGAGWEAIKREIAKCELVCANCHRIRTFNRNQNRKHAPLV